MSEVVLTKQKIKPRKLSKVKRWMKDIQERADEATETLQAEGVYTELAFLEKTDSGTFLVTYMEAADLESAWEPFEESDREIDMELKQFMRECLEDSGGDHAIEPLYHFTNPER